MCCCFKNLFTTYIFLKAINYLYVDYYLTNFKLINYIEKFNTLIGDADFNLGNTKFMFFK